MLCQCGMGFATDDGHDIECSEYTVNVLNSLADHLEDKLVRAEKKIVELEAKLKKRTEGIQDTLHDHIKYPQLRLPKMQAQRLEFAIRPFDPSD